MTGIHPNHPALKQARQRGLIVGESSIKLTRGRESDASEAKRVSLGDRPEGLMRLVKVRTVSRTNGPRIDRAAISRPKREREAVEAAFADVRFQMADFASGCVVTMTRCGPRGLDEDNLSGALKSVRDAIAQLIYGGTPGQRDDDPRCEWRYAQLKTPVHAVLVTVEAKKGNAE